jgi:hypothetical protein
VTDRIADDAAVVDRYGRDADLLDLSTVPAWRDHHGDARARLPLTVEHLPSEPTRLGEVPVDYDPDRVYEIPPSLDLVLEPHYDRLHELFVESGSFSGRSLRLDAVEDGRFVAGRTSYYRTFRTQFCPEVTLAAGRTLRDLTDDLLVDDAGAVRPLAASPFSNAFGGGTLAVTTDGRALFSRRSDEVAVAAGAASVSCSGGASLEGDDDPTAGLDWFLRREMREELGLADEDCRGFCYLGTVRRLEWMGKPDLCSLALLEADATPRITSGEHTSLTERDLGVDRRIETPADLLAPEVADAVADAVAAETEGLDDAASTLPAVAWLVDRLS